MGRRFGRRTIPDNAHVTTAVVFGPDAHALALAGSMAVATNTFSPMANGVHMPTVDSAPTPRGYTGDRGYGVNRMGGRTDPLQYYSSAITSIQHPVSHRLGIGAGAAGQPGLPSTGQDGGGLASLAWLGYGQLGQFGLGQ